MNKINPAFIISFYDEFEFVIKSINNIKNEFNESVIITVHSNNECANDSLDNIKKLSSEYISLSDLSSSHTRDLLPSEAITRNYSEACKKLYEIGCDFDCLVFLTGDTLLFDPGNIRRRYAEMKEKNLLAMVSKAIGQKFHASTDDPKNGIMCNRYQDYNTTDFMPQFFIVDGNVLRNTKGFSNIKITNKWTSEQCLGDELKRIIPENTNEKVGILNNTNVFYAYAYSDGIIYHARTNGVPGR